MKASSRKGNCGTRSTRNKAGAASDKRRFVDNLEACLALLEGAYADNTLRAYRADFKTFINWCVAAGTRPLPATPIAVVEFVRRDADTSKTATVRRRLAAISRIHRLSGHVDPTKDERVYLAMRRMHRQKGRLQKQAHGLTWDLLEKMLVVSGDGTRGLRDRVLLRLAYETLRRRAELVSLQVEDLALKADGSGSILLRFSKTDQEGEGRKLLLSKDTVSECVEWISRLGIPGIFQRLARQAGLPAAVISAISGHSTRVGAAQDMLSRGHSLAQIMHRGGWKKPETVMRYVEYAGVET